MQTIAFMWLNICDAGSNLCAWDQLNNFNIKVF